MTRRLRFELTEQEKQEFIQIINELAHPDDIVEIPENFKKDLYDKFTHRKG